MELLVAVGLLALLVYVLSLIFTQGLKALRVGYNRAEMYASARTALDQMMREIPSAINDGTASYPFIGLRANDPGIFRGADSVGPELYFVGQVAGAGQSEVVELGYWLARTNAANNFPRELQRFYITDAATTGFELYTGPAFTADFATPTGATGSNLLAENIVDLTFLYHYRTSVNPDVWANPPADQWNSTLNLVPNVDAQGNLKNPDGLPDAVEVRITVRDKLQREAPKTLTVFIPLET